MKTVRIRATVHTHAHLYMMQTNTMFSQTLTRVGISKGGGVVDALSCACVTALRLTRFSENRGGHNSSRSELMWGEAQLTAIVRTIPAPTE